MENKNQLHGVLSLFLLVVTVLLIYSVFWGPLARLGSQYPARTISVSAQGETIARPDIASTSFSVVTEGSNTASITDENNKKTNDIIGYLKEQGIDQKDIKTTGYSLSPVYTQGGISSAPFTPRIASYSLRQTVQVKIRDFSKISSILSGLISRGANQLGGVSFAIDDPEQYLQEARGEALQKARAKAQQMAKDGEFRLGKLITVNEYANPSPVYSRVSALGGAVMDAPEIAPPTIEPGSSEVQVTINAVYEIR